MRRLRVLLLTQWFDPEPTFKGLVFARELQRQGFDVEVLTGFPNYPGGRLYPGYRVKFLQRECIDGIRVTRVPLYPSHDRSAIGRVLNYATFAASASFCGLFMAGRFDVVYAYHPPLTVGVAASVIRLLRRVPVVYDIQDLWPDTLRATGMIRNRRVLTFVSAVCDWVYRRMDRIVVLSPGLRRHLVERGVPDEKITVIPNWADENSLASPVGNLPRDFPAADRFRIVFAGNMGRAQALDTVLGAAALLKASGTIVSFVMIGGGIEAEALAQRARDMGLDNVCFLPPVPMSEIGTVLGAADALLVHLRKDPLFEITIPSKTQAYMASGKPILMAVEGDAANLICESNCGLIVEPGNAESLAQAAVLLSTWSREQLEACGQRARDYYQRHLSLEVGVRRFGEVFASLV